MGVNRDKPDLWKADISQSVDEYNKWFLRYAPRAYRQTRTITSKVVSEAMTALHDFTAVNVASLKETPSLIRTLRMSTCPPLAVDRVIGLAEVSKNLVRKMENNSLPSRMDSATLNQELARIIRTIKKLLDREIFVWLDDKRKPTPEERYRAATVIADRLCGSNANPIVRNAQERRQLNKITKWLRQRGYRVAPYGTPHYEMDPGTFALQLDIVVELNTNQSVRVPIDIAIMPKRSRQGKMPLLVEAKSAGDFANVNKRRKEEATKINQLRATYGSDVSFVLFLCGYFDTGYLGYEAAEGIDWIWEHRINDFEELGL